MPWFFCTINRNQFFSSGLFSLVESISTKNLTQPNLWIIQINWDIVFWTCLFFFKEECSIEHKRSGGLRLTKSQQMQPNVSVFLSFGWTDPLMKTLLSSSLILVFPFVTPLKRHSRQMLAGFSFNETRLPESECWQCLSKAQCEAEWLSGPRSHRGGRPWPRSCLPLSPINSNCLLQLFTGTMSDVFLYSRRPQTPNRRFYHADKGQKGEKKNLEKMGLKGMTKWLAEVWEGWIHCVLHLQNGFLMPRYRTQTLANRATFSRGRREKKNGEAPVKGKCFWLILH